MQREDVDPSPSTDGGKEDTSVEGTSAAGVGTAAVCSPLEEFIQVTSPPLFDWGVHTKIWPLKQHEPSEFEYDTPNKYCSYAEARIFLHPIRHLLQF